MTLKLARRFEDVFWREYRVDRDLERAAVVGGVGTNVARRWIRECGGVIRMRVADCGHRLSFEEREEIEEMLARGHTQAEIAREIGRGPSTISREIARNLARRAAATAGCYSSRIRRGWRSSRRRLGRAAQQPSCPVTACWRRRCRRGSAGPSG